MKNRAWIAELIRRPAGPWPAVLLLLAAALLAACTRGTSIESGWVEGVPRNQTFKNVLVVGINPDYNTRCRFERSMAARLRSPAVTATASCSILDPKDPLTREAIVAIVSSIKADAVLTTELRASSAGMVEGGGKENRGGLYVKPVGYGYGSSYYGSFGVPVVAVDVIAEQSTATLQRDVTVGSNFYDARTATEIYGLTTSVYDKESQSDVIDALTRAIAARLRQEKLVE